MLVDTGYADELQRSFLIISVLMYCNMMFLAQHLVTLLYTKRMGRFYDFPQILHLTDLALFAQSVTILSWISNDLYKGIDRSKGLISFED